MNKRYIILIKESTKEQDAEFVTFVKDNGLGWWRWISNSWLLIDSKGIFSAAQIRDEIKRVYNSANLVIELKDGNDTWAGFGPAHGKKSMFKWLKDNWKRKL